MTTDWVIAKFTYFTFDPTGGRGGKFLITVMLIYRHLVKNWQNYLQIQTWPVFYNAWSVLNLNDRVASIQK